MLSPVKMETLKFHIKKHVMSLVVVFFKNKTLLLSFMFCYSIVHT